MFFFFWGGHRKDKNILLWWCLIFGSQPTPNDRLTDQCNTTCQARQHGMRYVSFVTHERLACPSKSFSKLDNAPFSTNALRHTAASSPTSLPTLPAISAALVEAARVDPPSPPEAGAAGAAAAGDAGNSLASTLRFCVEVVSGVVDLL